MSCNGISRHHDEGDGCAMSSREVEVEVEAETETDARGSSVSADEGDARGTSAGAAAPVAKAPTSRNDRFYNMKHQERGMAIIFNHEHFEVQALRSRAGTAVDCDALERTLRWLGFRVTVFRDLPHKEVNARISQAAQADHSRFDCLLVVVLTHGELGRLYARDTHYKAEMIWHSFTADRCPTLAGKPKLFFIQACQGDQLDGGVILSEYTETDGPNSTSYKIPIHADFFIGYSTIPGYYSWRNTTRGSWFIQALVQELQAHGKDCSLLEIMTNVNRRVAFDYESNTPDSHVMHQQKQVSCFTSMLTRSLVFGEK